MAAPKARGRWHRLRGRARPLPPLGRAAVAAGGVALLAAVLALWLGDSSAGTEAEHRLLPDPSLDIGAAAGGGIDDPCGATVDAQGNAYISSRSGSAVHVFGPGSKHLGAVRNLEGPCGLATDAKGRLYVSEAGSGEVVRYAPEVYPFRGRASYGQPVTIDASGRARGIAVDPHDQRLYVAKGDRIDVYKFNGALGQNELQRVLVFAATGGSFRLSFGGKETGPLPHDATHAEVEAALAGLPTIGRGNVSVAEGLEGGNDHYVSFEIGRAHV